MIMDMNVEFQNIERPEQNYYLVDNCYYLNGRSGAGTQFPVIKQVAKDTLIDVKLVQNGWAFDGECWYSTKYLSKYLDDVYWENTVNTHYLNMRSGAGTNYPVKKVLKMGDVVDVINQQGNWLQVKHKGTTGWVSGIYIR